MFFFCSDLAWRSWASSVLDWLKSSGCPHGHNCTDGLRLPVALAGQQQGVLIVKGLTMPSLQVHTPWWYQDKIEKVNHHLMNFNLICSSLLVCRQRTGWGEWEVTPWQPNNSLAHTWRVVCSHNLLHWGRNMYDVQINSHLIRLILVYISNWKRVKLVLGCSPFEQRHTGELMAGFVDDVCAPFSPIIYKLPQICRDILLCSRGCLIVLTMLHI